MLTISREPWAKRKVHSQSVKSWKRHKKVQNITQKKEKQGNIRLTGTHRLLRQGGIATANPCKSAASKKSKHKVNSHLLPVVSKKNPHFHTKHKLLNDTSKSQKCKVGWTCTHHLLRVIVAPKRQKLSQEQENGKHYVNLDLHHTADISPENRGKA